MKTINFLDIYYILKDFLPHIQFSYLTKQEIVKNLNFPIKELALQEEVIPVFSEKAICLIVAESCHRSFPLDYFVNLQNIDGIKIEKINFINKKFAVVMAGLGQYGKNQLIYNQDLGFDLHLETYLIYNDVINLPIRDNPNYNILSLCKDCNLCALNCPAKAIHIEENGPHWLDQDACRNFYLYGDHKSIPSVKYGINLYLKNKYSKEELSTVKDKESFRALFGFDDKDFVSKENEEEYQLEIDFCRECMNQAPCRKKLYIYNKENINFRKTKKFDF